MVVRASDVNRQSPAPTSGPEGSDLRSVANKIEGLLDDDGQFNPNPDQLSRGHPDYDESKDPRAKSPDRDTKGRYKAAAPGDDADDTGSQDYIEQSDDDLDAAAGDDSNADTGDAGDTDEDLATSAGDDASTDDAETGDEIRTLAEFAEALEMSVDDFKEGMTHSFNAADGEVTVTLAELEKGYQKDADYRRSTAKLADDRRVAEGEYQQRMQGYEQQNYFLANQLQIAENVVAAELNDPRLAELRERDPAEWTARREEVGQRLNVLRNARNQSAAAYEQFTNSNLSQLREQESARLLEAIPDFGSTHRATARDLMSTLGYSGEEIVNVFDHRVIKGALELAALRTEVAELRQLKGDAANVVKRVKKDVPKLTKPGKQRAKPGVRRDNVQRLKQRARKSGNLGDAARVIETMI